MQTLHYLELVYSQNHLNHAKIFDLKLFKIMANLIEFSRLEQRSVMKSLVAEKCKPYEIYGRTCDVYREACFIKKKCLQMV